MTDITLDTAKALDTLAFQIFDPHLNTTTLTYDGPATGLQGPDPATDVALYNAIAPLAPIIDGRDISPNHPYTLNVTCALLLRPRHWYLRGLMEYSSASLWPANCELAYEITPGGVYSGCNSFGWSPGLATCAAIAHAWAMITRMWLMKNYPLAVTQYTGPLPTP